MHLCSPAPIPECAKMNNISSEYLLDPQIQLPQLVA